MRLLPLVFAGVLFLSGCADISPISPNLRNDIENQGEIEDIRNNQNGLMLEMGKIRQEQEIMAGEIRNLQQGLVNQYNENSGVQILHGNGGLIFTFSLAVIALMLIYHYKTKSDRKEQMAEILAHQVAQRGDPELDDGVFLAAMNTDVEEDVYNLMVKHQSK